MRSLISGDWFFTLEKDQQDFVELAIWLFERENSSETANSGESSAQNQTKLADYSFILFPASKAYEGFLKKYLFNIGILNQRQYESKRFRIGRALNPDISQNHRDEHWLYDDIARRCGDDVARELWETWLKCRNRVFHYFPGQKSSLELSEVQNRLIRVISAMQLAYSCQVKPN